MVYLGISSKFNFWKIYLNRRNFAPRNRDKKMKKQTIAIHTPYVRPDVYGSLAVPIYSNVSFEFNDAQTMSDSSCTARRKTLKRFFSLLRV